MPSELPVTNTHAVGVVGLGSLGLAVARHLLDAGIDVVGYRRSPAAEFTALGGRLARSPAMVFESAPVILTCLPDDDALDAVISGADGFLANRSPGRVVIELSTTSLERRTEHRLRLQAAGVALVDCPVSGGPVAVGKKEAVFLVSGDEGDVARVEPILRLISNQVRRVGAFGSGTVVKYLANYLMVIHAAAAAEMVALARLSDVDPDLVVEILSNSPAGSYQLAFRGPGMVRGIYPRHATLDGLRKDLSLIGAAAKLRGHRGGLFEVAVDLVEETRALGFGQHDPTALIEATRARDATG